MPASSFIDENGTGKWVEIKTQCPLGRPRMNGIATGNHQEHRTPGSNDPPVVLELRHVFFGGRFLRERPRQHELGLENRLGCLDPAVKRCAHPPDRRMPDLLLEIGDDLPRYWPRTSAD